MSRQKNLRKMNYCDDDDYYDDDYEDDYGVSPGGEEYVFDRNHQATKASLFNQSDENREEDSPGRTAEKQELSEINMAKLVSCKEIIRSVIGDTASDADLTDEIIKADFNAEVALDAILKAQSEKSESGAAKAAPMKNRTDSQTGPKRNKTPGRVRPVARVVPTVAKTVTKGFNLGGGGGGDSVRSPQIPKSKNRVSQSDPGSKLEKKFEALTTAPGQATSDTKNKVKFPEDKRDFLSIYKKNRGESKEQLHLVIVGHVDAGKSTLVGKLLCDVGEVSKKEIHKYQQESKKIGKQSFALAWALDELEEERERGVTIDIGYSKFETDTKLVTLMDAPGHKDFIPNMISGATQADVALLVVDATTGEFETGFESGGQTREHALLLRSLGVSQLAVVVNKLDTVNWSQERYNEIVEKMSVFLQQAGYKNKVPFVPCSGLSGENVTTPPKAEALASWYSGPSILSVIDNFKCPERPVDKPFRFSVNDTFNGTGSNFGVSGRVETGMVAVGDKVLVAPHNEIAVVRGIQLDEIPTQNAFAGDCVSLTLNGMDQQNVTAGDVVCAPSKPIPITTCFQAHIVVFNVAVPITMSLPVQLHVQSLEQQAVITKLIAKLEKSTGEVVKKEPRCLPKNTSGIIEIQTDQPICLELYKDVQQLGRVTLRVDGTTVAAGLVTKIE